MLDQKFQENIKNFVSRALDVPWVDRGRDWTGWDCWGLVRLAFADCFGIILPGGGEFSCREPQAAGQALAAGAAAWLAVDWGRERPGDVLFARPCHVGLILGRGEMLHCSEQAGRTLIQRYDNALWRGQTEGIYRHVQLA